jgi:hypothetical protein
MIEKMNKDELVKLLNQRYGDGVVYQFRGEDRNVFRCAANMGYISKDGYITAKGRKAAK